jgi:hypothetical protein
MPEQGKRQTHCAYAELLIGKALEFNQRSKSAKRIREALLLVALRELQAESPVIADRGGPRSE